MAKDANFVDMSRSGHAKPQIWLIWVLHTTGTMSLRYVTLDPKRARKVRKQLAGHDRIIKAWIEQRDLDHLYGERDESLMQAINKNELFALADSLRSL